MRWHFGESSQRRPSPPRFLLPPVPALVVVGSATAATRVLSLASRVLSGSLVWNDGMGKVKRD